MEQSVSQSQPKVDWLECMCFLSAIKVQRDHKSSALDDEFHGG